MSNICPICTVHWKNKQTTVYFMNIWVKGGGQESGSV